MSKIVMITAILAGAILAGCSSSNRKALMNRDRLLLTNDEVMRLVNKKNDRTYIAVLAKIKSGLRSGEYAVFPGRGIQTNGYILENFDPKEFDEQLTNLPENRCVWIELEGDFRPFSAPYPINPEVDPWATVCNYKILSASIGKKPIWAENPPHGSK